MFDNFKPTKAEKQAIDAAFQWLLDNIGEDYRSKYYMKQERRGYGNTNDRVLEIAAKDLCVRFFMEGVRHPDALPRDCYYMRPAAIWFQGKGAARVGGAAINMPLLQDGIDAYNAAFQRMQDAMMGR